MSQHRHAPFYIQALEILLAIVVMVEIWDYARYGQLPWTTWDVWRWALNLK